MISFLMKMRNAVSHNIPKWQESLGMNFNNHHPNITGRFKMKITLELFSNKVAFVKSWLRRPLILRSQTSILITDVVITER